MLPTVTSEDVCRSIRNDKFINQCFYMCCLLMFVTAVCLSFLLKLSRDFFNSLPCIRQLRPRYERQSKLWCPCPVCVLRNVLGPRFRLRFRMLRMKTEKNSVFCVCKQNEEFIATEAIQSSRSIQTNPERQGIFQ